MQHGNFCRGLLGATVIVIGIFAVALMGCGNGDGDDDTIEISDGLVSLAGTDGAALTGLTFDFPNATIFGFPGETATLAIGSDALTFTLTLSGGAVINGTINPGRIADVSCRLTQNLQEVGAEEEQFDAEYDSCEGTVNSDGDIELGSSGPGTVILSLGNTDETPAVSNPETVTLNLADDGTATINNNATPI
jgi:hypothetical protein